MTLKKYAKINGNIVENVVLSTEEDILSLEGKYVECAQDASIRYNFPGPGSIYDEENDAFINSSPYPSWVLNESFKWEAPTPKPESGKWWWNESETSWVEIV
jgi:hypothetical protein